MENGVFDNRQYVIKQLQSMMTFCLNLEFKSVSESFEIITIFEITFILKYNNGKYQ